MGDEKPKDIKEYKKWLKDNHKFEITERTRNHYDSTTNKMRTDFEKSAFWLELTAGMKNLNEEYQLKNSGYNLFSDPSNKPEIFIKSFDSFILKTYRKNILENERWPAEPENGWIFPNNWFEKINDIIRTRFVVKYIDGVDFLVKPLDALYTKLYNKPCKIDYEAKEEGYYAAHVSTKIKFEIVGSSWETEKVETSVEIQIMTQLQDLIVMLLHKYYETNRKEITRDEKWQWNYKSDEFAANYLGHILHYVEGMIVEIRDK